ncbi:DUF2479 domain-containing protein [uncultured Lentilactobacillus sp.]|uniref:DUF2479 domain-containing protein n=1 Tax=uncultured Lentilactobacillus sp. TaxID=2805375 RepID=UPI0025929C88|nr:DUF2479 domain-containing protein [uncultured Lentilactobacillus sp.]
MAENKPELQRVTIDLTRYEHTTMDISGKFNARVADDDDHIPLNITDNGHPVNVTRMGVSWGGTDNEANIHHHIRRIEDLPLCPGDAPAIGKFTLPLDGKTFNVPGAWQQFFLTFSDADGKTVSSVDLKFDVYGNSWMMSIGKAGHDYIEEFEQILNLVTKAGNDETNGIHDFGKKFRDDLNAWITDYKQKINDALAAVDDPKTGLMVRYASLLEMTKQVQETLKQAQFHGKANQYSTIADLKADATLMAGDTAIVKGSEDYNDGKGAVYAIRSKLTEDKPDGVRLIALDNGTVAERNDSIVSQGYLHDHGIFPNAGTVKLGTAHIKLGDDQYPQFSVRIYQYGAGIPQPEGVDIAGGTASYDVPCRVVRIDPETVDVYLSPEHYTDYFSDYHLDSPEASCGGDSAYLYTGISCMQVQVHGAEMVRFDVATNFKC